MGPTPATATTATSGDTTPRVLACDPVGGPNAALAVAAARAGATGVVDLGPDRALALLDDVLARTAAAPGTVALRLGVADAAALAPTLPAALTTVVVDARADADALAAAVAALAPRTVLVEVTAPADADAAVAAGAAGLIAVGCEAGGRVGTTEASILLQQIVASPARGDVPVWLRGGVGLHTAAAAVAGGATGVVLDAQLAATRESSLGDDVRATVAAMDGSETRVVGDHRVFTRPDLPAATLDEATEPAAVAAALGATLADLLPIGVDGALAASFARRFGTVGGVVQAIEAAIDDHLATARATAPLAPGAGVSVGHGTRYPITQAR